MVNLPVFFTSAVASAANSSNIVAHSFFLRPLLVAKASAMPPFVIALAVTAFFFMTATIAQKGWRNQQRIWK